MPTSGVAWVVPSQSGPTDRKKSQKKKNRWRKVCCPNGRKDGNGWSMARVEGKTNIIEMAKNLFFMACRNSKLWNQCRNRKMDGLLLENNWPFDYHYRHRLCTLQMRKTSINGQWAMDNGHWANRKWIYCDWVLFLIYINCGREAVVGEGARPVADTGNNLLWIQMVNYTEMRISWLYTIYSCGYHLNQLPLVWEVK